MAVQFTQEQASLLADRESLKVLTTVDHQSGTPHAVIKQSIHLADDGNIHYLELLESSRTNHNLVNAIWFDRTVSILVKGPGQQSFQIKGRPVRVHITGPLFEKHYVEIRDHLGDVDLSGVWVIEPEVVIDENFWNRKDHEESNRPFFRHLDRLALTQSYSNN
jgi:hypothetical protein